MPRQLNLFVPKKRVRRRGRALGRRPRAERVGFMPHEAREVHDFRHPVHVTMRRKARGPDFRAQRVCALILRELARAREKGVRVVQYSIQADHLHLMIEGADAADLSTQMRTLFARIAMMVNHLVKRRGALFRDRHHRHALKTPREVRNALVYILFNARKHLDQRAPASEAQALADAPDPCSSAPWFTDWSAAAPPPPEIVHATRLDLPAAAPTTPSATWLGMVGWKRAGGPIRFDETPRRSL